MASYAVDFKGWVEALPTFGVSSIRTDLAPNGEWYAIDSDTYDGAPDAGRAGAMGWGKTEQDAIDDLLEQLAE